MAAEIERSAAGKIHKRGISMFRFNLTLFTIVAVIALSSSFLSSSAQMFTLADKVRANHGKPLSIPAPPGLSILSIDDLSARSDLIVTSQLVRQRSYVSEDGIHVFTDYQIVPHQVLVARTTTAMANPGQTPPLVLVLRGGQVVIDGTQVTVSHSVSLPPPGQAEFLIFAKAQKGEANRFELIDQRAGLFEIQQSSIRSLQRGEHDNPKIKDVRLDKILTRIRDSVSK
jgi:hypothetical protein